MFVLNSFLSVVKSFTLKCNHFLGTSIARFKSGQLFKRYMKKLMLMVITSLFLFSIAFASNGQYTAIKMAGDSMWPTLKDGETKFCYTKDSYVPGDIVAFSNGSDLVGHRIVGNIFGKLITKGDNNPIFDLNLLDSNDIICAIS